MVKIVEGKMKGKMLKMVGKAHDFSMEEFKIIISQYNANEQEWLKYREDPGLMYRQMIMIKIMDLYDIDRDIVTYYEMADDDAIYFVNNEYPKLASAILDKWLYWRSLV